MTDPTPEDPATTKATVEAEKAQAEATKAKADAEKAAADAAKATSDARKAEAENAKAIAEARKAERDANEEDSPAAHEKRDAERRKATAEADQAAATARRSQLAALIPDFSKIERGELTLKGDLPLFGTALAQRATEAAATTLATRTLSALGQHEGWTILVTSDDNLIDSDAPYLDVVTGLDQLDSAAQKLLEEQAPAPQTAAEGAFVAADAIGALASALPGVLSLFSAHRTVSTAALTADDLAAAAATAGALKSATSGGIVVHDDFRLLASGVVHEKLAELSTKRERLIGRKLELQDEKATHPNDATKLAGITSRLELIESVISAIDTFVAALRSIPQGGTRSPLTQASMREELHDPARFTHVLLVKSAGGSTQQTVDDRPLWFKDKFSVVAAVSLTYMLIAITDSGVVAAGTASGSAVGHGTIGRDFRLEVERGPV